jgi:hypothetical protein
MPFSKPKVAGFETLCGTLGGSVTTSPRLADSPPYRRWNAESRT